MKIRLGFVSNSSSTSYVIALTRDFKTTQDKVQKFMDLCDEWANVEITSLEQADEVIGRIVEALCSQSYIWLEESSVENLSEFINVFGDEIIIGAVDVSSESGSVSNIMADSCKEETMKKLKKLVETKNED